MKFDKITAGTAIAHLYRRFPPPEFFAVHEMALGGDGIGRRADFVALRLWGNRPGHLLGFEVKVSRADFLHELRQPDKRAPLEDLCAATYFVAPHGVVSLQELPQGWGLLELQANGLRMRQEAKHRSQPNSPAVYHALMKRMFDDRWHDRARKPAMLDWPKEMFSYIGKDLTPGQLTALAQGVFWSEKEAMVADVRREAKAAEKSKREDAVRDRTAIMRAVAQVVGKGAWEMERFSVDEILAMLEEIRRSGVGAGNVLHSLDAVKTALDRASAVLAGARESLTTPLEVPVDRF